MNRVSNIWVAIVVLASIPFIKAPRRGPGNLDLPPLDPGVFETARKKEHDKFEKKKVKALQLSVMATGGDGRGLMPIQGAPPEAKLLLGGADAARVFARAYATDPAGAGHCLLMINVAHDATPESAPFPIMHLDQTPVPHKKEAIDSVVERLSTSAPQYISTNWHDNETKSVELKRISEELDLIGDAIYGAHKKGCTVVVHCRAGKSRSATVVLDYLLRFGQWDRILSEKGSEDFVRVTETQRRMLDYMSAKRDEVEIFSGFEALVHERLGTRIAAKEAGHLAGSVEVTPLHPAGAAREAERINGSGGAGGRPVSPGVPGGTDPKAAAAQ